MGGFRSDGNLIERLEEAEQLLWREGHDSYSDDVAEAVARLKVLEAVQRELKQLEERVRWL